KLYRPGLHRLVTAPVEYEPGLVVGLRYADAPGFQKEVEGVEVATGAELGVGGKGHLINGNSSSTAHLRTLSGFFVRSEFHVFIVSAKRTFSGSFALDKALLINRSRNRNSALLPFEVTPSMRPVKNSSAN